MQEFKINGLGSLLTKDIALEVLQKSEKTYTIRKGFYWFSLNHLKSTWENIAV